MLDIKITYDFFGDTIEESDTKKADEEENFPCGLMHTSITGK